MDNRSTIEKDCQKLSQFFYSMYDHSYALHVWESLEKSNKTIPSGVGLIGEGSHFKAFCYQVSPRCRLVIKIAQQGFVKKKSYGSQKDWYRDLKTVGSLHLPLIPPQEILEQRGQWAIVMPYAEQSFEEAHSHWHPISGFKAKLSAGLLANGYIIKDLYQIRCWQGIPFVYDLSDLQRA